MSSTPSAMGEVDKTIREGVRAVVGEAIMKSKPSATELLRTMEMLDSNLMTTVRAQILEAAIMKLGQDFSLDIKKQWDDDRAEMEESIRSFQTKEKQLTKELSMIRKEVFDNNAAMKAQKTLLEQAQGEITKLGQELLLTKKDKTLLEQAQGEITKLGQELLLTKKEEADGKRKMEEAHKTSLEEAQEECTHVRKRLTFVKRRLRQRNLLLATSSAEKAKNDLQIDHERVKLTLAEEKEKSLCEICMHAHKDSVCLPCLHLRYCFGCLEKHKQLSRTCPFCRVPLNGVIRSEISMFSN